MTGPAGTPAGAAVGGAAVGGAAGKVYGYARCSTSEKRQDVERQVAELRAMGAQFVVQEYESGADPGRKGIAGLLGALREGDSLFATELSRVTRSLRQLCDIIEAAKDKSLTLRFGAVEFAFRGGRLAPFQTAMLQLMGVFAELERNLAAERINSGLCHARAKGVRLGRPKKTAADVPPAVRALFGAHARGEVSAAELARRAGISKSSACKYLKLLKLELEGGASC